jgi:SagB-type dehydrogenase family enzyme
MHQDRFSEMTAQSTIVLPSPGFNSPASLERLIARRRSIREFNEQPLSLDQLSQLLWSTQGITDGKQLRAAPSAGATFPLEVVVVAGAFGVSSLPAGSYLYLPKDHSLMPRQTGDLRLHLAGESLGQQAINVAPVSLVIAADYERTRSRYRNRTERYVHMEAGHAAQNLYLQAEALGLGTTSIGAFNDNGVKELLALGGNLAPLYIMPVGYAASGP